MPPFRFKPFALSPPPAPPAGPGPTRELPDEIDALDAELHALRGQTLAMTDGFGTWMRPRVVLLTLGGQKPTAVLSGPDFLLLGHVRKCGYLELTVEDSALGTQGALRLMFPAFGWRLHAVLPTATAWAVPPGAWSTPRGAPPTASDPSPSAPPQADAPDQPPTAPPQADAEGSARRKRDEIFRRMFS